jgi:hypothetical protein
MYRGLSTRCQATTVKQSTTECPSSNRRVYTATREQSNNWRDIYYAVRVEVL